jgi:hypothetical protein
MPMHESGLGLLAIGCPRRLRQRAWLRIVELHIR